jgi:hypothetical protein
VFAFGDRLVVLELSVVEAGRFAEHVVVGVEHCSLEHWHVSHVGMLLCEFGQFELVQRTVHIFVVVVD